MTYPRSRFSRFYDSLKTIRYYWPMTKKKTPSGSNTVTCRPAFDDASPVAQNLHTTASLAEGYGSNRRKLKSRRRRRSRRGEALAPMTENVSSLQNCAGEQVAALDTLSKQTSWSHSLNEGDILTASQREVVSRSPKNALCMPQLHMWQTNEAADVDQATLEQAFLHRPADLHSLHDMLCSVEATVLADISSDQYLEEFEERENDALRDYFRVRTNIVLNSPDPERAPHIVISPVEETSDDYYIPWRNRVDYHCQDPTFLNAPHFDASRLTRMPYQNVECYWPVARNPSMMRGIPSRVFNPSRFHQLVLQTAGERLTMYHVVTAIQRHRLKAVAIEASQRALDSRKRYEDPDVFQTIEKPFEWTDPAQALLQCASWSGVVIIDSLHPFTVPHIMICTPPQQDPWISWTNATNDPQDAGFGRYLVVPSRTVDFINIPHSRYDDYDSGDELDLDLPETPSPPGTPYPETPTDFESDFEYFPVSDWQTDKNGLDDSLIDEGSYENWADGWEDPHTKDDIAARIVDLPPRPSRPIFYVDEDEEDALPPLDEWYQSVASRNGLKIAC